MSIPPPEQPAAVSLPLPDPEAYPDEPREYARALMQRKDDIEKELDVLKDVLSSHGVNASTPLIDPEGYPRGDIDVYSIRHTRATIARLAYDLQAVNDLLPAALAASFASPLASSSTQLNGGSTAQPTRTTNGPTSTSAASPVNDMPDQWPERPIARVNSVEPNSPSAEAGLQGGDLIFSFSGITHSSPGGLQAIGGVVQRSEGLPLTILVLRGSDRKRLRLTPRSGWGGRGSLGCHILPA